MIDLHYIVDTYAWIEYFMGSGKGKIVKNVLENTRNSFTTLKSCIAEVYQWCLKEGRKFETLFAIIRDYSSIESINLDAWMEAAKIRHEKRENIKGFGLMDAVILAKQREKRCKVITGGRHFQELPNVVFLR